MRSTLRQACLGLLTTVCVAAGTVPAVAQDLTTTSDPILQKLDNDMLQVVNLYDLIKGSHLEQLTPQDARQQFSLLDAGKILARGYDVAPQATAVGKVVDGVTIPGQNGIRLPIRIYYPEGTGPFPVVVYYHGGGFVVATIDTYDESARHLAVDANAIVVSVEYRKAPEAPFPAAFLDAVDAYRWVVNNIGSYNGIPSKVAVAGESAGGNLATEVAIAARDQQFQAPTHQLLIYPLTSSNLSQASDQAYTDTALPLYTALLPYFSAQYLLGNPGNANSILVSPILADLRGLAPATILNAEVDPLLSDGQAYAAALTAAKDTVTQVTYTEVTHEFYGLGNYVAKARQAELFGASQIAASFK